jgi:ribosomal protein S13
LVESIISHGLEAKTGEGTAQTFEGKPELVMLEGGYGSGKTFCLQRVLFDAREGQITVKADSEKRRAIVAAFHQPLHALVAEPHRMLDVLIQDLIAAAPNGKLRTLLVQTKTESEQLHSSESDQIKGKILIWRDCCDTAIKHGIDAILVLLDELEESVTDYERLGPGYKLVFSTLRQFADNQRGPVLTVLGITPEVREEFIPKAKEALLRRIAVFELLNLTSSREVIALAQGYDPTTVSWVDEKAFDTIYRETSGNPGWALAALHWCWEIANREGLTRVGEQIAKQSVDMIAWKGKRVRTTALTMEVEARYPTAKQALERSRESIREVSPSSVLEGLLLALEGMGTLRSPPQGLIESVSSTLGQREDLTKALIEAGLALFSEPNVEYSLLLFWGDNQFPDESGLTELLRTWRSANGDFAIVVTPGASVDLMARIERVTSQLGLYKGADSRDSILVVSLEEDDQLHFASLAQLHTTVASVTDIKASQRYLAEKYKLNVEIEDRVRKLRGLGRTFPYRWDARYLTKEVQYAIYRLLVKRFVGRDFSSKDAFAFVLGHLQSEPDLVNYCEKVRERREYTDEAEFRTRINQDIIGVLETLVEQGLAIKKANNYNIPPLVPYEEQLYREISTIKQNEKKNPGTDDLKVRFFGYSPRWNSIYGIACGMEGKGYLKLIQQGVRRFYAPYDSEERYLQIQATLNKLASRFEDAISDVFKRNDVRIERKTVSEFAQALESRQHQAKEEVEAILARASKENDPLTKLRVLNEGEVRIMLNLDEVATVSQQWIQLRRMLESKEGELSTLDSVAETTVQSGKLTQEKFKEIQLSVRKASSLAIETNKALAKFDTDSGDKLLRELQSSIAGIGKSLEKELAQLAQVQKAVKEAEDHLEDIRKLIQSVQSAAETLELDSHAKKVEAQIERAKKNIAKGKMEHVKVDPVPVLVRNALQPKEEHVARQLDLLREAQSLLTLLGQSQSKSDKLIMMLPRAEKDLERARDDSARGNLAGYITKLAELWQDIDQQKSAFVNLEDLYRGAVKTKRTEFKRMGVDKSLADPLNLDLTNVRKLRHLLEEIGAVRVLDVEVGEP